MSWAAATPAKAPARAPRTASSRSWDLTFLSTAKALGGAVAAIYPPSVWYV